MTKVIDSSNLGYLLGKIDGEYWKKAAVVPIGLDEVPAKDSPNLVTSGGVFNAINGQYVTAWDGASAPVAANIPAGVSVTYGGATTTGTLAASASTRGKIYLVSDGNGQYDRYYTSYDGSSYSWAPMGSTTMGLDGYALQADLEKEAGDCILVDGFGAVADGATDCTDAIMDALEAARTSGKRLVFGDGTYLTRKGLVLTSGMRVEGNGKTELKNASAVLNDYNGEAGNGYCAVTRTSEAAAQGATTVKVSSLAGLAVGQEVTIIDGTIPSYQETSADITAISDGGGGVTYPVISQGSYNSSSGASVDGGKMMRTSIFAASGTIHYTYTTPVGTSWAINQNLQIYTYKADDSYIERIVISSPSGTEKEVTLGALVAKIAFVLNGSANGSEPTASDIAAYQGCLAYGTGTPGEKSITIDTSRFSADGTNTGLKAAVGANGYVTTDFSLIKTVDTKAAEDISIKKLKLSPCGSTNEPYIYLISPINQTHQTAGAPQGKMVVEDVEINGSAHDGISAQGSGEVYINRCYVHGTRFKAIHFGTSCDKVSITGNYLQGCGNADTAPAGGSNGGGGAVYFCVNNHRVLITGNHVDDCKRGVFGFDWRGNGETDTDSIVEGNTFTACSLYGVYLLGGLRAIVQANIFRSFASTAIPIFVAADTHTLRGSVISGNIIGGFGASTADAAIKVTGATDLVLSGNNICALAPNSDTTTYPASIGHCCDIVVTGSTKVLITGNLTDGAIDDSDAGNSGIVKANNITGS